MVCEHTIKGLPACEFWMSILSVSCDTQTIRNDFATMLFSLGFVDHPSWLIDGVLCCRHPYGRTEGLVPASPIIGQTRRTGFEPCPSPNTIVSPTLMKTSLSHRMWNLWETIYLRFSVLTLTIGLENEIFLLRFTFRHQAGVRRNDLLWLNIRLT